VLTCIRRGTTLARAGRLLAPNAERYVKSPEEMGRLFRAWPELLERTLEIAERCTFSMESLTYVYPHEVVPGGGGEGGYTPLGWLRELCRRGLHARYAGRPPVAVARQVDYELDIIERLGFASYFLTVHDIVRFARERGILCQGRGSAANSAVCFVLGVTSVDPAHQSLLFERFLSEERGEPPDIDIDFEHERREEVLQYVYARYGRDRAAMVNEVIRWRGRSAVRDVGRAVGLDAEHVEHLARVLDHGRRGPPDPVRLREVGFDPADPRVEHIHAMCAQLQGAPRHTSIHVGGFVISDPPLCDRAPIEPARMEGRTVLQWDKDDVDTLGFVKVDLLALGMLTALRRAFDHVRAFHGVQLDLATVPREDPAVYALLCAGDSTGVFQVESRAQQGMLPRLKPRCFYDLVVETAIVRPGPIQGGMVHPYLRRRAGEEEVSYVDPRLEPILARTLGVPIFQEQVMAMAVAVGGFTPGEADQLRRAMGAWRRRGNLGPIGERLQAGLRANGIPEVYAAQIFAQIQGFAEYGFPESHAASFAHLVYVSAWLRTHHPAAFCAALLDSQPMGFYAPRSLVADVQRHGVEVRPVDVRASSWDCSLEPGADGPALRLGLRMVRGLGAEEGRRVVAARHVRDFSGLSDLARRAGLGRGVLRRLARAGALDGLLGGAEGSCRTAAWAVGALGTELLAGLEPSLDVDLPPMEPFEALREAYSSVGLAVEGHPLGIVRAELAREGIVPLAGLSGLAHGTRVEIAGLVAHRQRPSTASGVVFLGLEDETGTANVVVWPTLYERRRSVVRGEPCIRVSGLVQRQGAAISVLAQGVRALPQVPRLPARSRDFR
jgi:error-prone DNA polymerase